MFVQVSRDNSSVMMVFGWVRRDLEKVVAPGPDGTLLWPCLPEINRSCPDESLRTLCALLRQHVW